MPSFTHEQLIDLAEGRIAPVEAAALREQIAAEPAVLTELRAVEALIALMRSDDSVDAPEHVINRALRLMRPPVSSVEPGLLRRIAAVLRSDSRQMPLAMGMRSEQSAARNLVYNAEDRDLDLQILPSGALWQVRGQVLGPEESGTAELRNDQTFVSAELSELGEFVLPPVAADRYQFLLRQGDREVVIEDLEVGLLPQQS
ncbi:MAG: hypothetical protein HC822_24440 [Oscillochloris sp.]|nr:hypothetical protein [Oscillochloris sp.]